MSMKDLHFQLITVLREEEFRKKKCILWPNFDDVLGFRDYWFWGERRMMQVLSYWVSLTFLLQRVKNPYILILPDSAFWTWLGLQLCWIFLFMTLLRRLTKYHRKCSIGSCGVSMYVIFQLLFLSYAVFSSLTFSPLLYTIIFLRIKFEKKVHGWQQ